MRVQALEHGCRGGRVFDDGRCRLLLDAARRRDEVQLADLVTVRAVPVPVPATCREIDFWRDDRSLPPQWTVPDALAAPPTKRKAYAMAPVGEPTPPPVASTPGVLVDLVG